MFRTLRAVVLASIGIWLICALALVIYTKDAPGPQTRTLVIPDGSYELILAGENPLEIPKTWNFLSDDTLELVNQDRIAHQLGGFFVPSQSTRAYKLDQSFGGSLFCSLHPSGEVTIDVEVRDFDWRSTVFPTITLGPVVGLVLSGVRRVMGLLDEPDKRADRPDGAPPDGDRTATYEEARGVSR